ncbi:MAG: DAHL domain-containing protein, partial [Azovibrio sp.]
MKVHGSTKLLPWLLMVFLAAALLLLYELSTQVNVDERVRVELGIRQAMMLDTQINLDVLRLRNQQLLNYDTLAQAGNQMDALLLSLQEDFERMGLPSTLAGLQKSWVNKAMVLDDFKRQNAVLSNSLYHFVNLSNKLNVWRGASGEEMALLNGVSRDVLVMINGQQTRPSLVTQDALKGLAEKSRSWPEPERESAGLMAAHGKLIMDSYFPVQNMVSALMHNPMSDDLEAAYGEYSRAHLKTAAKAEFFRQWMAGFAFLMLAAAILILLRLQQVGRALATSHSLLDNVTDHLGEGILSFDANGKFNFMNRRAELLLERSEHELLGQPLEVLLPGKQGQIAPLLAALKLGQPFEGEGWLRRPLGDSFPAAFLGGPLPSLDEEGTRG